MLTMSLPASRSFRRRDVRPRCHARSPVQDAQADGTALGRRPATGAARTAHPRSAESGIDSRGSVDGHNGPYRP